ncbi:hypothetical protein EF72_21470 [Salmonella enterica]|nr:hypothetical protein [Salmonella enterica]
MTDTADLPIALTPPKSIVRPWKALEAIEVYMGLNVPDGDVISHETVAAILGVPVDTPFLTYGEVQKFQLERIQRFEKFRWLLLKEHSIYLKNVPGQGYYQVPPIEQAGIATHDAMKVIAKALRRAMMILFYTRKDGLTNHQNQRHLDAEMRMESFRQMASQQRKNIFADDEDDDGDDEGFED